MLDAFLADNVNTILDYSQVYICNSVVFYALPDQLASLDRHVQLT